MLIIKGAIYKSGDTLLRPHYSGEMWMVDCTEFKTSETIADEYDEENVAEFMGNTLLSCDGVNYYECEYSPWHTKDFELLSDLSDLEFYDEETEF